MIWASILWFHPFMRRDLTVPVGAGRVFPEALTRSAFASGAGKRDGVGLKFVKALVYGILSVAQKCLRIPGLLLTAPLQNAPGPQLQVSRQLMSGASAPILHHQSHVPRANDDVVVSRRMAWFRAKFVCLMTCYPMLCWVCSRIPMLALFSSVATSWCMPSLGMERREKR